MRSWCLLPTLLLSCVAGCVPADEAIALGSAQFTITGRGSPRVLADEVVDGWTIRMNRFVLSFKTMTIVNLRNSDQCAYRGRGAASNVVFEGLEGSVVQAFNGIKPGACPDVGIRLGAPNDQTVLGEGATIQDLLALTTGTPAIAILDATATRRALTGETMTEDRVMRISLRFDATRTAIAFGGCRDAIPGARIRPEARYGVLAAFALETLFLDDLSPRAALRFAPFLLADRLGNGDRTVTMDELDAMSVDALVGLGGNYSLPDGARGSFGDYVRKQFQLSAKFGKDGQCNGLDPGTALDK